MLRPAARMDLVSMRMILPNWLMNHEPAGLVDEVDAGDLPDLASGLQTEFPKWESLKNKPGKSGMFFEPES